jgi:formylglycine-generating enzyme
LINKNSKFQKNKKMKTHHNSFIVVLILGLCLGIGTGCIKDDESLPVLLTTEVTQLHLTSATGGGVICSEGGAAVTERGVCWNTTGQPTIQDSTTIDGSGSGIFTSEVSGLKTGTRYYFRAYATNSFGTAYGNEVEYTTQQDFNIEKVSIQAGTFIMGSPLKEVGRWGELENQFEVTLSAFQMGKYEITNEQYALFLNAKKIPSFPLSYEGGFVLFHPAIEDLWGLCKLVYADSQWVVQPGFEKHPMVWVTWHGAYAFAKFVGGRLPTEAEWEHACRAGTTTPFYTGTCITPDDAAYNWERVYSGCDTIKANYEQTTFEVGSFPPNPWGLFDMQGNVHEWCNDYFAEYPTTPQTNPTGPETGTSRCNRGGSYLSGPRECRSASRGNPEPNSLYGMGFRVAFDE